MVHSRALLRETKFRSALPRGERPRVLAALQAVKGRFDPRSRAGSDTSRRGSYR